MEWRRSIRFHRPKAVGSWLSRCPSSAPGPGFCSPLMASLTDALLPGHCVRAMLPIAASQTANTRSRPNLSATSAAALAPSRRRKSSSPPNCSSADDSLAISPGGTNSPVRPLSIISPGPLGQSKATTGIPQPMASSNAFGKPSKREDSTKMSEWRSHWRGSLRIPGISTSARNPSASTWAASVVLSDPSPMIASCQPASTSPEMANARNNRSKPFCGTKRPTAATVRRPASAGGLGKVDAGRTVGFGNTPD